MIDQILVPHVIGGMFTVLGGFISGEIGIFIAHRIRKMQIKGNRAMLATTLYNEIDESVKFSSSMLSDIKKDKVVFFNLLETTKEYRNVYTNGIGKIGSLGSDVCRRIMQIDRQVAIVSYGNALDVPAEHYAARIEMIESIVKKGNQLLTRLEPLIIKL